MRSYTEPFYTLFWPTLRQPQSIGEEMIVMYERVVSTIRETEHSWWNGAGEPPEGLAETLASAAIAAMKNELAKAIAELSHAVAACEVSKMYGDKWIQGHRQACSDIITLLHEVDVR